VRTGGPAARLIALIPYRQWRHALPDSIGRFRHAMANSYRIEWELGHGGMGLVYLAEDLKNHRRVAIKILRPEVTAAIGPERFRREIEIVAGLTHPNILPLHHSGEAAGLLYFVAPYLEGESLRHRLAREHQLPIEDALRITREVADALGYAHAHGVVHRDVKPENILFQAGHAIVSDFGIARVVTTSGNETLTDSGIAVGTPAYMSPEQAGGSKHVDARSDVYSLGCVLFEMLTGQPPITGSTPQEIIAKKLTEPAPRASVKRDAVPPVVEAALIKALARKTSDRFATAPEFAAALDASMPPHSPDKDGAPRRKLLAAGTLAIGAIIATALLLRPHGSEATFNPNLIAVMPFRAPGATHELQQLAEQIPVILWTKITGEFGPHVTDPATVGAAWHQAGGSLESGLPEQQELLIARQQGAALLIRGVIEGTNDQVMITASVLGVPEGAVRVPPTTVIGPTRRWIQLMDSLVVMLLTKDFGVAADRFRELSRYSPEAIEAYLAGLRAWTAGDGPQAQRFLSRALEADSGFVLAAYEKYNLGETDTAAARYAWEHQDQLDPRTRAFFKAQAGPLFGATRTVAASISQWDSISRTWPELGVARVELAEELLEAGGLAGEPAWLSRSRALWRDLIPPRGGAHWLVLFHALNAAALDVDTVAMRDYLGRFVTPLPPKSFAFVLLPEYRWRLETLTGDSAAAARAFPTSGTRESDAADEWSLIPSFAILDGRGISGADSAASLTGYWKVKMVWARCRDAPARRLVPRRRRGFCGPCSSTVCPAPRRQPDYDLRTRRRSGRCSLLGHFVASRSCRHTWCSFRNRTTERRGHSSLSTSGLRWPHRRSLDAI
jgi:hypothetical protein